jgi:uncharacterized protein (TIGR03435 family)
VFELVIAREGPKLLPASGPETRRGEELRTAGQNWELTGNLSIGALIGVFSMQPEVRGRLIENRTNLPGVYRVTAHWTQDRTGGIEPTTDQYPPLFTALEQQLGLRLVESKEPLETLVIDHIERPSNN